MKKHLKNFLPFLILLGILFSIEILTLKKPNIEYYTSDYFCDVKFFSLKTKIAIMKNDTQEIIANIQGKSLRFFTDPLAMYTNNGKVAYSNDEYHFISQDSHCIYENDKPIIEMVGKFKLFGDEYNIYNMDGQIIATAKFNALNTYGTVVGIDGTLWADYSSHFLRRDYDVRITEFSYAEINENAMLMLMASFYSDRKFDSSSSN